jgi:hypothetical protein
MLTTSKTKRTTAAVLLLCAVAFSVNMDSLGESTNPYEWTMSSSVQSNEWVPILLDIKELMYDNDRYHLTVETHQGTSLPEGNSKTMGIFVHGFLVNEGVPSYRIHLEDHGSSLPVERGKHETDALWQKRLNRMTLTLETRDE